MPRKKLDTIDREEFERRLEANNERLRLELMEAEERLHKRIGRLPIVELRKRSRLLAKVLDCDLCPDRYKTGMAQAVSIKKRLAKRRRFH